MTSPKRFCSHCGKELPQDTNVEFCSYCGSPINRTNIADQAQPAQKSPVFVQTPYKSPGTSMLIALIAGIFGLSGIGHIYVGKLRRGILLLVGGLALLILAAASSFAYNAALVYARYSYYSDNNNGAVGILILGIIFGLSYLALFIWQIFDVRTQAKTFNEAVKVEGKEPW
jgi:hypothetical protein